MSDALVGAFSCAFAIKSLARVSQLVRLNMEGDLPSEAQAELHDLAVLMDVTSARAAALITFLNTLDAEMAGERKGGENATR